MTVLPKEDYKFVMEDKGYLSFYKDGEPIVVLDKSHSYHPKYTETILNRIGIDAGVFAEQLRKCKASPQAPIP